MKLIEIPEDMNDLRDYNKFINTIVEVQKFNKNVSKFLMKVLTDEFFKTVVEWRKIVTKKDNLEIDKLFEDEITTQKFDNSELREDISNAKERLSKYEAVLKNGILIIDDYPTEDYIKDEKLNIYLLENQLNINALSKFDKYHIFYCYKTNKFIRPENKRTKISLNWSNPIVEPSNDGLKIVVTFKDSYKGWLPTYHAETKYVINLIEKSVEKYSEIITETSNKNYK